MSPTTSPSGCADKSNCMIRSRGSVPIAENISAYFATRSARFLFDPFSIFRYLQKYGWLSTLLSLAPSRTRFGSRLREISKAHSHLPWQIAVPQVHCGLGIVVVNPLRL